MFSFYSTFDEWLLCASMGDAEAARELDCTEREVWNWRRLIHVPEHAMRRKIARLTSGAVTEHDWPARRPGRRRSTATKSRTGSGS